MVRSNAPTSSEMAKKQCGEYADIAGSYRDRDATGEVAVQTDSEGLRSIQVTFVQRCPGRGSQGDGVAQS